MILQLVTEQEVNPSMVKSSLIKTLKLIIQNLTYYQWLMQEKILTGRNSLLHLYHVLGLMESMLFLVRLLREKISLMLYIVTLLQKTANQGYQFQLKLLEFFDHLNLFKSLSSINLGPIMHTKIFIILKFNLSSIFMNNW